VPMSPRVIELFQALGPGEPDALIFYNRSKPLGAMLFNQILARMLPGIEVTPHGFRSSFKQWAVERANYPDFVSEIALAHEEGNKVAAAYKRKFRASGEAQADDEGLERVLHVGSDRGRGRQRHRNRPLVFPQPYISVRRCVVAYLRDSVITRFGTAEKRSANPCDG
jgi:hypothetical protein